MPQRHTSQAITRARELRKRQTEAESLLWYVLRGRRLCGLKFRRQFPVEPFIADFACVEERLIVEIDGGYHDYTCADDQSRQRRRARSGPHDRASPLTPSLSPRLSAVRVAWVMLAARRGKSGGEGAGKTATITSTRKWTTCSPSGTPTRSNCCVSRTSGFCFERRRIEWLGARTRSQPPIGIGYSGREAPTTRTPALQVYADFEMKESCRILSLSSRYT